MGNESQRHQKKASAFFGGPHLALSDESVSEVASQVSSVNLMGQELDQRIPTGEVVQDILAQ